MKKKIAAEIIADSINNTGDRLTTVIITLPRIVLAEFNTHRILTRNSASSRAIPFKKMMELVLHDPFIPIKFLKDHSGMQGFEYMEGKDLEKATQIWLQSRVDAANRAQELSEAGVTKQICNRIIEPYMWHTILATGTEWQNFIALRAHDQAEIHIQECAYRFLEAYNESIPRLLQPGEWHIPFGDRIDESRFTDDFFHVKGLFPKIETPGYILPTIQEVKVQIATARCARISYNNFEGKDDYEADIKLHDNLAKSGHWSPFEHCAMALTEEQYNESVSTEISGLSEHTQFDRSYGWSGNFKGFVQYRKTFSGENRTDTRIIKK